MASVGVVPTSGLRDLTAGGHSGVDRLPEEMNDMKIRDDKEKEATIVNGNGTEAGHIIVTTIGGRNGQPKQDPVIRPLVEEDTETLQRFIPEIPLWVKNPDFDRVDWLNRFIELMRPYLDKAISKTAKNIAKPIIAEQIPKYKIESVEFEELTLGSLPPTFQGMKVYSTEEELIVEPSLKWAANPNVMVAVKAYGLIKVSG